MTEQEVLNRLHKHGASMTQDEAFVIMDALEKQIPKKPIWNTSDFINRHHCAICDGIVYVEQQYCDTCGQRIDWGNEDAD